MGDIRARDADRDRYVEVLEAAYVDGQLGAEDRELRVSRALQAQTLAELDMITRDLQGRPAPVPAPAPPAPARVSTAPRPRAVGGNRSMDKVGVGVVGSVLVGIALFAGVVSTTQAEDDWGVGVPEEQVAVPYEQLEAAERRPGFSMKARRVRDFVVAYEAEFGTLEAYEVRFFPRRVSAEVPVRGARPRYEGWTWDGEWTQDIDATAVVGTSGRVDLGDVDAPRLLANIDTARGALRVEQGRFTHAVLTRSAGDPVELNIYIGNEFNEFGYLSTTPAGEIVRRHPYAP